MTLPKSASLAIGASFLTLAAGLGWAVSPLLPSSPMTQVAQQRVINARPASLETGSSVADIVEQVQPAVVSITVEQTARPVDMSSSPFGGDDGPFGDLLRQFMGQGQLRQVPQQNVQALGSGFIIDNDGDILTNNHVVDGGRSFTVEFADKSIAKATLVGTDPQTDLAVIHVDRKTSVTPLSFANSDKLRVGDPVIAIGDPFGVGQTVTAGVVSARGRSLGDSSYVDYIQTDAPINQGNSGGPLLDYSGHVVGVNSAIFSPSGGNVGIGFAVPANTAMQVISQLKKEGKVTRAWLGAGIQDVTPPIAAAAGLSKAEGAIVAEVDPSGPSAKALRAGDIVTGFDGQPIREARDLSMAASHAQVGHEAKLSIVRQGQHEDVTVRLAQLSAKGDPSNAQLGGGDSEATPRLGVTVGQLDSDARQQLGLSSDVEGAVITQVDPEGAAAQSGLQPGDVIERVGDTPVKDLSTLRNALGKTRNDTALLLVDRGGQRHFFAVPLG